MQLQPFAPDRGKMRTAVNDRNGLAGKGELDREEAADRAGANDTDFHLTPPVRSLARHSGANIPVDCDRPPFVCLSRAGSAIELQAA
jgi:hypothetical protein